MFSLMIKQIIMKKKLLKLALVAGAGIVFTMSLEAKDGEFSRLVRLENIEALAGGIDGGGSGSTPSTIDCWNTVSNSGAGRQTHYSYCGSCAPLLAKQVSDKDHCPK